jgi:hypothetical protein
MNYQKGEHLKWWQSIPAIERFTLMRKYSVKQVNNKLIYKMWNGEFHSNDI